MDQEKKMKREIANSNERRRMQSINAGFNSLRTMLPHHDNEKLSKAAILQHTAEYIDQLEQDKTRYLQEVRAMEKLLNPDLLDLHQKNLQERDSKLIDHQPNLKRIKLDVNNSLDLSNSESSDEGIQCNSSPKQENQQSHNLNQPNANKTALLSTSDKSSLNVNDHPHTTAQFINNNQILITKSNSLATDSDDLEALKADLLNTRQILDKERRLRMKLEEQVRILEAQLYPTKIKQIAHQVNLQFQAGTNSFPFSLQTKDLESETAVQSVIIDHLNQNVEDVVAETVEIETQDCAEFLVNSTNAINLLANNNHLLNQTNINSLNNLNQEPAVNKSSTIHLSLPSDLQPINNSMNNNLITTANQTKDKIIMDVVPNKILTSTAYVTTGYCTVQQNQFKPKNFGRTDKNVNKQKQHSQVKNSSSVASNNSQNSAITISTNKKIQAITSNSSVTSSTSLKTTNQNESTSKKDKQQKKPKLNIPISTSTAINVPMYTGVSIEEPIAYNGNVEINTTNNKLIEQSSLVQKSPGETAAAVQMIDNCNLATSTLDNSTINKTTTKSATSNNLDTIVEAIRHLEGDRFYDQNSSLVIESKKQLDKLCKDDKELVEELRINKEVENLRMSKDQQSMEQSMDQESKDRLMRNDLNSSGSRQEGVVVSSV